MTDDELKEVTTKLQMVISQHLAFPSRFPVSGSPGLTKRELFAAMAMQAFLTRSDRTDVPIGGNLTEAACVYAESLIEALERSPSERRG